MIGASFTMSERAMWRWTALGLLAALALSCGSGDHTSKTASPSEGSPTAPPPTRTENPPPQQPQKCDGHVAIFLRGASSDAFGQVDLELGALTSADGLDVHDAFTGKVNVASERAWRVAVVDLPRSPGYHELRLPILGGALDCIPFDRCTGPIRLYLNLDLVSPARCHAIIDLDLWPSITAAMTKQGFRPLFVPNYRVTYL